tara:strand:- start:2124 stop:3293 length:1170 start_codon:yes stop_codon:yes gene_type:complete
MKHKKLTITAASLLTAFTAQLQAGFYDWQGGTSSDWSVNSNWQGGNGVGAADTARIYNTGVTLAPAAVLSGSASVTRVWLGNQSAPESGALTVQSGATLSASGDFIVSQNSTLASSGAISVGNGNGMIVRDSGNVTLNSGATLNKLTLSEDSTATLNAGSSVTTIQNLANNAQLTMNNTYSSNLDMNNASSLTLNGTLNGRFGVASTAMQYIGETGTVNGDIELNSSDQMTVAGDVNGRFSLNQTSQAIIEATANILSNSNNSWIYNDAAVTWNVGADGSIGTLRTNRGSGDFTADWRYAGAEDMVVDLTAYEADGSSISLQLVSGIENESTFASNVTFLRDGSDVTSDFSWDGAGTGSFSGVVVPEPGTYALLAGCFALASVMIRRRR